MNRCGVLNVAFCITNPELIEPEYKPEKSINWLLNVYSVIAIPAVT